MLSTILPLIALGVAGLALGIALFSLGDGRKRAVAVANYVTKHNKASVSLKRMTDLEVQMTEISDSVTALHESLRKLRARITMRQHRAEPKNTADGIPDSKTDPDGWKRAMRIQLHNRQLK